MICFKGVECINFDLFGSRKSCDFNFLRSVTDTPCHVKHSPADVYCQGVGVLPRVRLCVHTDGVLRSGRPDERTVGGAAPGHQLVHGVLEPSRTYAPSLGVSRPEHGPVGHCHL